MDNFNIDEHRYDNSEWKQVSVPVYGKPEDIISENSVAQSIAETKSACKVRFRSPVLTFQLILCIAFLTLMFLFSSFLPDLFSVIKSKYDEEINTSVYFNGDFSNFDFTRIFATTNDEV